MLVIHNGQVVDGTGKAPVRDGALVIRDGLSVYVGEAARMPEVPPDTTRINAHWGTILRGLVEARFDVTDFNIGALEDLDIKYPVENVSFLPASTHGWPSSVATPPRDPEAACSMWTSGSRRRSRRIWCPAHGFRRAVGRSVPRAGC